VKRLVPAGLWAALALLTAQLFPGCLNPRPEEDPSFTSPDNSKDDAEGSGIGSGGAGGSGTGVNVDIPSDNVPPPASSAPDAGAPSSDAGLWPVDAAADSSSDAD
jgi:hypothetical protein